MSHDHWNVIERNQPATPQPAYWIIIIHLPLLEKKNNNSHTAIHTFNLLKYFNRTCAPSLLQKSISLFNVFFFIKKNYIIQKNSIRCVTPSAPNAISSSIWDWKLKNSQARKNKNVAQFEHEQQKWRYARQQQRKTQKKTNWLYFLFPSAKLIVSLSCLAYGRKSVENYYLLYCAHRDAILFHTNSLHKHFCRFSGHSYNNYSIQIFFHLKKICFCCLFFFFCYFYLDWPHVDKRFCLIYGEIVITRRWIVIRLCFKKITANFYGVHWNHVVVRKIVHIACIIYPHLTVWYYFKQWMREVWFGSRNINGQF